MQDQSRLAYREIYISHCMIIRYKPPVGQALPNRVLRDRGGKPAKFPAVRTNFQKVVEREKNVFQIGGAVAASAALHGCLSVRAFRHVPQWRTSDCAAWSTR